MSLFTVSSLLCGVFAAILSVFSIFAGTGKTYRLLAVLNIVIAIWGAGCFIVGISNTSEAALIGWKIGDIGGFFIAPIFFHCVAELFDLKRTFIIGFGYVQAIIFTILNLTTNLVMSKTRWVYGLHYLDAGWILGVATVIFVVYVGMSYLELCRHFLSKDSLKKFQAEFIAFGFFFGFSGGTTVLFPEFHIDLIYPAGNIGIFIYAAIVSYALLRHNIFDTQVVVKLARREKMKAMGMLAASISHEIRNPLYVIQGLAGSFLANRDEGIYPKNDQTIERADEIMVKVGHHATRAMEIMKNFALFTKQNYSENPDLKRVDVHQTLERIVPLVSHELDLEKIVFVREVPAGMQLIQGDPRHIEEIFVNLIVNACQAIKNANIEQGRITISAVQRNGSVNVTVADNGPGMSAKQLKQVFEPFYTTKEEGTGLGLYITKQLVEKNGGRISVQSKSGSGTSFELEFKR